MDVTFEGPAGALHGTLWLPEGEPRAAAAVCHPHPQHGGRMNSNVVFRAARGLQQAGCAVLRFDFRGVGRSEGVHHGEGGPGSEEDDLGAALELLAQRFPGLPLVAGGFSFGARQVIGYVTREPLPRAEIERVLLIALPVLAYECEPAARLALPGLYVGAENDAFGNRSDVLGRFPQLQEVLELQEIEQADHFFAGRTRDLQALVRAWAQSWLERPPT